MPAAESALTAIPKSWPIPICPGSERQPTSTANFPKTNTFSWWWWTERRPTRHSTQRRNWHAGWSEDRSFSCVCANRMQPPISGATACFSCLPPKSRISPITCSPAQPFLGTLAADPSARGVLDAVDLFAQGALRGEIEPAKIDQPLEALASSAEAARAGRHQPLSWQTLLSGRKSGTSELRHFVLARAVLDYGQIHAATRGLDAIKTSAQAAGFGPESCESECGVTGPVALDNDQLAALTENATFSTALCLGLLCLWLTICLHSPRTMLAILVTLIVGLIGCAAFCGFGS